MLRIACISQKGGVGKSTLARDIAVQFAANGWNTAIADLDVRQTTSGLWNDSRKEAGIAPSVTVATFPAVDEAIRLNGHDLVVFDGKPYSDADTRKIAIASDLIVIPTGPTRDDLYPQTLLAHELVQAKVDPNRILFVLNSVSSDLDGSEVTAAKQWLSEAGLRVAGAVLPRRTAYGQVHNVGRSISEVTHPSLRVHPVSLVQEIGFILIPKGNA
jgi:chromosome partitioning protein